MDVEGLDEAEVDVAIRHDLHLVELEVGRIFFVGFEHGEHRRPVDQVATPSEGNLALALEAHAPKDMSVLGRAGGEEPTLAARIPHETLAVAVERHGRRIADVPLDAVFARGEADALGVYGVVVVVVEAHHQLGVEIGLVVGDNGADVVSSLRARVVEADSIGAGALFDGELAHGLRLPVKAVGARVGARIEGGEASAFDIEENADGGDAGRDGTLARAALHAPFAREGVEDVPRVLRILDELLIGAEEEVGGGEIRLYEARGRAHGASLSSVKYPKLYGDILAAIAPVPLLTASYLQTPA